MHHSDGVFFPVFPCSITVRLCSHINKNDCIAAEFLTDFLNRYRDVFNRAMEATGRLATKAYVEMSLGVSIVNELYILPADRKKIVAIDVSGLFGVAERGLLNRKGRYLTGAAREFMTMVRGKG